LKLIILAAGEGKRLRPYTNNLPKCMVKLKEQSLLSRQLSSISKCDIPSENIALVGGYQAECLQEFNLKTYQNPNYASTNMVSTLFCANNFMDPNEDLIISYGDIVYEENVLRTLIDSSAEVAVVADQKWERLWSLRMTNPLDDAETFVLKDNFLIAELGNKAESLSQIQAQYIGLIKVRADKINQLKSLYNQIDKSLKFNGQDFENMYMTSFIQILIDSGWEVRAALIKNGWLEVDTVEDLESYEKISKEILDSYCCL